MQADIGRAAGTIWQYLDQHGEASVSKLKQGTKLPDWLLYMGCGWLARENKLALTREGKSLRVSLKAE